MEDFLFSWTSYFSMGSFFLVTSQAGVRRRGWTELEQMKFYIPSLKPMATPSHPHHVSHDAYLRLSQAQPAGQLLPLSADHVVILLEGALQTQQLRRREGRADAFGLPGERSVEQQVLWTAVLTWTHTASRRHHTHTADIALTVGADGKYSDAPLAAKTQSR